MKTAGTHAATLAAGGALAHAGLLILFAALVLGLAELGVPSWLSALIVAAGVIGVGYSLMNQGISKMRTIRFEPTQTMETLKENATWTSRTRA